MTNSLIMVLLCYVYVIIILNIYLSKCLLFNRWMKKFRLEVGLVRLIFSMLLIVIEG